MGVVNARIAKRLSSKILESVVETGVSFGDRFEPSLGSRLGRLIVKHRLAPNFGCSTPPEDTQRVMLSMARLAVLPRGIQVEKIQVKGLHTEWVRPTNAAHNDKAILYLHGGGFMSGSCTTHREMVARIVKESGIPALVPEYRLAPWDRYPAANEDCLSVFQWLLKQGYKPGDIVIGGDSAGGFLTLATLLALKNAKEKLPAGAFFLSPLTDAINFDGESYQNRAKADPWFDPRDIVHCVNIFTGPMQDKPADLSPLNQDLTGLPPLLIQVGDQEVLLNDSTRLAEHAKAAGVDATVEVWDNMWHVFHTFGAIMPESRKAIANIGAFVRRNLL